MNFRIYKRKSWWRRWCENSSAGLTVSIWHLNSLGTHMQIWTHMNQMLSLKWRGVYVIPGKSFSEFWNFTMWKYFTKEVLINATHCSDFVYNSNMNHGLYSLILNRWNNVSSWNPRIPPHNRERWNKVLKTRITSSSSIASIFARLFEPSSVEKGFEITYVYSLQSDKAMLWLSLWGIYWNVHFSIHGPTKHYLPLSKNDKQRQIIVPAMIL